MDSFKYLTSTSVGACTHNILSLKRRDRLFTLQLIYNVLQSGRKFPAHRDSRRRPENGATYIYYNIISVRTSIDLYAWDERISVKILQCCHNVWFMLYNLYVYHYYYIAQHYHHRQQQKYIAHVAIRLLLLQQQRSGIEIPLLIIIFNVLCAIKIKVKK